MSEFFAELTNCLQGRLKPNFPILELTQGFQVFISHLFFHRLNSNQANHVLIVRPLDSNGIFRGILAAIGKDNRLSL